ncbi:App1 family protein [Aggregatilinea lenta]|uniref:App1 family protein n=1 Tax=Aggregatilinea lenta TaxID=913108 RepID=UPI000E5BFCD6|nr:phosphatase domain-containing protein [Aggregatilinea lenta]
MGDWKEVLSYVASNVEDQYDALKMNLRERLGIGPIHLLPYLGHGTPYGLHISGRILEDYHVEPAADNDTIWENLHNMYRRFRTKEIPHARVRARFRDHEEEVTADDEGIFHINMAWETPLPLNNVWHEVQLELLDYPDQHVTAMGQVIVPPPNAQFGVISDLDDTVIQTDVFNLVAMARNTFLHNSRTRLPFAGVAEFYLALQRGTANTYNPIYYVSNSPFNLYDLLMDFFEVRQIPLGPLFLTNLGLTDEHFFRADPVEHKLGAIDTILTTHPDLPFVLIGDSGEQDAAIYLEALEKYPGRIKAIYIRDVTPDREDKRVVEAMAHAADTDVDLLLVEDTVAAAVHAAEHGLIVPEALPGIRQERTEDQKEPDTLEKIVKQVSKPLSP